MSVTTLYFLRHGETDYNRKGIVQGGGIDSVLNQLGQEQAQAFFDHYHQKFSFDAIYASTLQRTHQTLQPWRENGLAMQTHHGLNEFNWGIHEGKVPTRKQRESFRDILSKWGQGQLHQKVEKGESPIEAWQRAKSFFDTILSKHRGQNILLCSHGRQLRVIFSNLLNVGMDNMEQYSMKNTGLSIIKIQANNHKTLEVLNDTTHLTALGVKLL